MSIYSTKDAFELYIYYLALKKHFTTDYDFFKYNGKVKASVDAFENRKDKYFFYKLSKRSDAKEYILANIAHNPDLWIGDIGDDKAEDIYGTWKKIHQSLLYSFQQDINTLDEDFDSNLISKDGQHPKILRLYLSKQIRPETLIMINEVTGVFNYWDKKLVDRVLWPDIKKKCIKYRPFLSFDKTKIKSILVNTFRNTSQ
jgi:hypothetical protein